MQRLLVVIALTLAAALAACGDDKESSDPGVGKPVEVDNAEVMVVGEGGVWVAEGREVVRIDPKTGERAGSVQMPGSVTRLAVGGGYVWATLSTRPAYTVARIDPQTQQIVGDPTPIGGQDERGNRDQTPGAGDLFFGEGQAWAVSSDDTVTRIDAKTGERRDPPLEIPQLIDEIVFGGGSVWAVAGTEGTGENARLYRFDPSSGEQVGEPRSLADAGSEFADILSAGDSLWIASGPNLTRLNARDGSEKGTPVQLPSPIANLAAGGHYLWAGSFRGNLTPLDLESGRPAGAAPVRAEHLTADNDFAWALYGGVLTRVSARSGKPDGEVKLKGNATELLSGEGAVWVLDRGKEDIEESINEPNTVTRISRDLGGQ